LVERECFIFVIIFETRGTPVTTTQGTVFARTRRTFGLFFVLSYLKQGACNLLGVVQLWRSLLVFIAFLFKIFPFSARFGRWWDDV